MGPIEAGGGSVAWEPPWEMDWEVAGVEPFLRTGVLVGGCEMVGVEG